MSIAKKLTAVAQNQQKVYDAGKETERSNFWERFQINGTRTNYNYAFYTQGWTDTIFKPKYDIIPTSFTQAFSSTGIIDLAGCLRSAGVILDTSNAAGFSYSFYSSQLENLPVINTTGAAKLDYTFNSSDKLHTVEKLILKADGSQTFTNTFTGCSALQNIIIEGCIGNNLSFSSCSKLTRESLLSILNALKALSGEAYKLTLGAANLEKLTSDEKAIAENKGWTLA